MADLAVGQHKFWLTSLSPAGSVSRDSIIIEYISEKISDLSRDFVRGNTQYKHVALTFDGDFLDNQADSILAILNRHDTPATFFLTGRFILKYPDLVRKLVQEKRSIGNHTRYHPHLTTYAENRKHHTLPEITAEKLKQELLKTAEIFEQVAGQKMDRIWRAPFGEHNREIRQWAAQIGYRQFGWTADYANHQSLDTVDWVTDQGALNYYSAGETLDRLIHFADTTPYGMNGGIVLMHLGTQRKKDQSYQMLGAL
ncbi:polysaccharide deacetylase family protein, partial [bacterium]|nr:polysaccharide deacetylase family protein [bacterium]